MSGNLLELHKKLLTDPYATIFTNENLYKLNELGIKVSRVKLWRWAAAGLITPPHSGRTNGVHMAEWRLMDVLRIYLFQKLFGRISIKKAKKLNKIIDELFETIYGKVPAKGY